MAAPMNNGCTNSEAISLSQNILFALLLQIANFVKNTSSSWSSSGSQSEK